ncbi:BTAD domain-containing putative transcriptional regulator [Actinomadura verrucosospora]|uniref:Winged helix family transcriptional regulator n=1 Tax=Actinomadura verrucosospora TaxID=46165 RepID=A0A7D4A1Z8_ACTVE|nr:BTAD domain-containing putative transcriptional regulator [Actinomadura verrucosospora]QKG20525.1 winged helix family transcriptional regulator [Actinomadura verrucosospora]
MLFGILGPVEVHGGGAETVPVGGPRVRALLAMLALDAGRVVTSERLIDGLYGEEPPAGAANALQSQVSRLRRGLGDAGLVEGHPAGYRLLAERDAVDAHRFEALARDGRRALGAGDRTRASVLLREALELWRGPALADVRSAPFAEPQAARLEEARAAVAEDHAEARLALGEFDAVIPGLRELLEAWPLRERARALLMRALYGAGRQAEALAVFEDGRRVLADELGADPSPELADVHVAILRGDLEGPAAAEPAQDVRLNLPAQFTSFVGRDEEVGRVGAMLAEGRLVTLLGPGGAGKTRLAVEAAAREEGEVCFVDLAPVDRAEVTKAVLGALGLRESGMMPGPGERPADGSERLVTALSGRRMLLVLDNCEHVVATVAPLAHRLLSACPELRVLATSREALAITGEALWPLPPLALPPEGTPAAEVTGYPAVRLFADRAAAVRPDFAVDEGNVGAVLRICGALDGLPLAIELAAARLRSLPVEQVATRLDDRFRLLSRGNRTAAPRHQTLRAVVEWSWELLDEAEQTLARRLTVFTGGLTMEAAAQVCDLDDADELLVELADKSLLQGDGTRYRMLDTVRAFCAERLAEAGEEERFQRAHAAYFLDLARRAEPHLRGAEQLEWLGLLAADHGNLHAALRRSVRLDAVLALRLVAALSWYWWLRGRIEGASIASELLDVVGLDPPEGCEEEYVLCVMNAVSAGATGDRAQAWLDRAETLLHGIHRVLTYPSTIVQYALTAGPSRTQFSVFAVHVGHDPWAQALLHMSDGFLHQFSGDADRAEESCTAAVAGFRACGDRWGTANSLDPLAQIADWRGDRERALELLDEALELTGQLGALEDTADLLYRRAEVLVHAGDPDRAAAELERGIELARRAGAPDKVAGGYTGLGGIARLRGDLGEARRLYEAALTRFASERFIARAVRGTALVGLGWITAAEGDAGRARELFREALTISSDHPIFTYRSGAAVGLAGAALADGDAGRAARLAGVAALLRGPQIPADADAVRVEADVRAVLGGDRYDAAFAEGAALPREEALAELGVAADPAESAASGSLRELAGD